MDNNKINKTLDITNIGEAKENISDIKVFGDGDIFQLIVKASSSKEGWMKSTKAMDTGNGCVIQVTTQQRNSDGSYAVAEALTFVPNVFIHGDGENRKIVPIGKNLHQSATIEYSTNCKTTETMILEAGATASRLTPDYITSCIKKVEFHRLTDVLTVCVITLKNGFMVTGESACASPENYNKEIGEKISKENAFEKIWMLEGYLLKQRLYEDTLHLCDTCSKEFATCDSKILEYGNGVGNDNVIRCDGYETSTQSTKDI